MTGRVTHELYENQRWMMSGCQCYGPSLKHFTIMPPQGAAISSPRIASRGPVRAYRVF